MSTERIPSARLLLVSVLMMASAISAAPQEKQSVSARAPSRLPALPKTCLAETHPNDKISELLETIHDHPTAGAYNTLGVLFAQQDRVSCAIPAFETSVHLQDPNWEAHYNLAIALLRNGSRAKATQELQTAIQQKPDSVSSRFALASVFEDEKKFAEAETHLRAVLSLDPQFTPGILKLSDILIKQEKPKDAVTVLEEALKQKLPADQSESVEAALGLAYAQAGNQQKGLGTLNSLVASHPDSAESHFHLGLLLAQSEKAGDLDQAASHFREALRLDPKLDAARLALGRALTSSQKFADAATVLLEYTSRQSGDAQGFYAIALAYQGLQKPQLAIQALRRSVELDSKNAETRLALGKLLASAGQVDLAIKQLQVAERIKPADSEIYAHLVPLLEKAGHVEEARVEKRKLASLQSRGDKDKAIGKLNDEANRLLLAGDAKSAAEKYRSAVQLNPADAKLHYNLSLALDRMGEIPSEKKELLRSVELEPQFSSAQNQLGLLALRAGEQQEAESRFKKSLESNPKFGEAQSNLAVLYSQQGKNAEAASLFQQAIANDPTYSKAHVNYGLLLAQQGALPDAEQQFRTAIEVNSNDADAYAALGMLLAKTGNGPGAVKCFRKAAELEPNSATAHLNLGIALVDQFDRPGGFHEFSEAARLDPRLAAPHYNLGRFHYESGKYEDAARELETAVRLQPDHAGALYFLALTEKQQNQPERSAELLQKVVQLQPGNADAQYLLGQSLEHSGDTRGAIAHWKAALQADPNHSQALYNLSKTLNKEHDPDAKQYQDRFEALQKEQQLADRVSQLGNFALEAANAQNWPQALEQMNEAIQLCGNCPQSAHLHKNLGLFYGRTGNIGEAKKELQTALQLAPNDTDARNALTALDRASDERVK